MTDVKTVATDEGNKALAWIKKYWYQILIVFPIGVVVGHYLWR